MQLQCIHVYYISPGSTFKQNCLFLLNFERMTMLVETPCIYFLNIRNNIAAIHRNHNTGRIWRPLMQGSRICLKFKKNNYFFCKIVHKTRDLQNNLHSNNTVNSHSKSSPLVFNPAVSQCE
jgi:hypothetical protein